MRPLTKQFPKAMLSVAGKPILEWSINLLKEDLGIKEIIIVIGFEGDKISSYFGDGNDFGVKIRYITQNLEKEKGLAAAVNLTEEYIENDFILLLGDNLYKGPFNEILELHRKEKPTVTLHIEEVEDPTRYGVVVLDSKNKAKVKHLLEKPINPPSNTVITGFYVLSPKIFDAIDRIQTSVRGELEITDAIDLLAKEDDVRAVKIDGWRKDLGYPADLVEASRWILSNGEQEILTELDDTVTIKPPVFIGKKCKISNSIIGPYTSIGNNVKIEKSKIENSVILDNVELTNSDVIDSVIDMENKIKIKQ